MKRLLDLKINESSKIVDIDEKCKLKQRLMDLGMNENSVITCVLDSAHHNPKAYSVKNSIFALRSSIAQHILVE